MAAFLSILIPGLGHVYNGRLTRGILLFSIWTIWSGLIMFLTLTLMDQPSQDSHITLFYGIFLISIVIHFAILSSAIKKTLKLETSSYKKRADLIRRKTIIDIELSEIKDRMTNANREFHQKQEDSLLTCVLRIESLTKREGVIIRYLLSTI